MCMHIPTCTNSLPITRYRIYVLPCHDASLGRYVAQKVHTPIHTFGQWQFMLCDIKIFTRQQQSYILFILHIIIVRPPLSLQHSMVYFFHHYEIPAVIQHGTVHHVTATINIHEHQRAPAARPTNQQNTAQVSHQEPASNGVLYHNRSASCCVSWMSVTMYSIQKLFDFRSWK